MASNNHTSPQPSPLARVHSAYMATTGQYDLISAYKSYRYELVEAMTVSGIDSHSFQQSFTLLTQYADPVAQALNELDEDPALEERLREIIRTSYELLP